MQQNEVKSSHPESEELLKNEEFFKSLLENSLDSVALLDETSRIKYITPSVKKIFGVQPEDFIGKSWFNMIYEEDIALVKEKLYSVLQSPGNIEFITCRVKAGSGNVLWIEASGINKLNEPDINSIIVNFRDITSRKADEERLRDTTLRLAVLLGNLGNVVLYETGGGREFVTQNIFRLLGYPPEKFTEDRAFFTTLIHPDDSAEIDIQSEIWRKSGAKESLKLEFRCKRSNGSYIWLEDYMTLIVPRDTEAYMTGILIDITERKEAEDHIRKSLKEKEVLLKEIHHRVKNNLQIISSLLKMQSGYLKNDDDAQIVKKSLNHIRSMAIIHQLLYKSDNFSRINFGDYLKELLNYLPEMLNIGKVIFIVDVKNIVLSMDISIPCALLINEIVSNSLKHAFNDDIPNPQIKIQLKNDSGIHELIISDNGSGLPADFKLNSDRTFGIQLIQTLLTQIEAKMDIDTSSGTKFTIRFSDNQYRERLN